MSRWAHNRSRGSVGAPSARYNTRLPRRAPSYRCSESNRAWEGRWFPGAPTNYTELAQAFARRVANTTHPSEVLDRLGHAVRPPGFPRARLPEAKRGGQIESRGSRQPRFPGLAVDPRGSRIF